MSVPLDYQSPEKLFRERDLELRWSWTYGKDPVKYMNIVRWIRDPKHSNGEYCFSIAAWRNESEGPELSFIGDRPFHYEVDHELFWKLAKIGHKLAYATWELYNA